MYPVLNDYVIRGTEEIPRLVNAKKSTGVFFIRPLSILNIILQFNGLSTISEIAKANNIKIEILSGLIHKLLEKNIVTLKKRPTNASVDIKLGPHEPWLSEVHIDITDKCNLASFCPHCYRGDKLNKRSKHNTSDWKKVFDSLSDLGVHKVTISGGEAFLRKDFLSLLKHATAKNILISGIFTNGTINNSRTKKVISFLKKYKINTSFYISMDGPSPFTNDSYRGKGSFKKTLSFVKELKRSSGIKITINSQINILNIDLLTEWYEFIKSLGVYRWRMNAGRVYGRLQENDYLIVTEEELAEKYASLIKKYIADWKGGLTKMKINIESVFRTEMLTKSTAHIFNENLPICDYKRHSCSIEPTGDVQFYTSWGDKKFGNVFCEDISKIWYKESLQIIKSTTIGEITECKRCKILYICGGGCRLIAPELSQADPVACKRYKAFHKYILPILQKENIKLVV
jgi:radical SAM protein with 4Fe4S-binding SPASM domain